MALKKKLQTYKQFVGSMKKQDWDEYTEQWKKDVTHLQHLITDKWFGELEAEKLVRFNVIPVPRYEENLGDYLITTLELVFPNNKTIIIEPVAGVVIGADGKVDMYLSGSIKEKVVLLRKIIADSKPADWTIVKQFNGREQLNFNKTNIEKIIEEWLQ
jgi:hypothetical protein